MKSPVLPLAAAALASWAMITPAASGQAGEAFTATASVKTRNVSATAPVSITISRWATDSERASVNGALKSGGNHAAKEVLAKMPDCGKLEMGENHVPIKYAYARSTGSGRVVVLATAEPLLHTATGMPEAKPKSADDVAVAILVLEADNTGHGELAAAAQVKTTSSGAITIDHYDAPKIWLKNIAKQK